MTEAEAEAETGTGTGTGTMPRLRGRRVWLTGASSGIGAALARALARRGCRVALFARNAERLGVVRDECEALAREHSDDAVAPVVIAQTGDVTDRQRVADAVREAEEALGGLDVVILNAGIGEPVHVDRLDAESVRRVFDVNLMGAVHGIEAALPGFLARGQGTIVGVSSVGGYRGLPQSAAYCASKSALATFLESLRLDLAPRGVDVLTVSPGFVRTPLTDRNRFRMPFLLPPDRAAEIIVRGIERRKREIHFPLRLSLAMKLLRILPIWMFDPLMKSISRRQGGAFKE